MFWAVLIGLYEFPKSSPLDASIQATAPIQPQTYVAVTEPDTTANTPPGNGTQRSIRRFRKSDGSDRQSDST